MKKILPLLLCLTFFAAQAQAHDGYAVYVYDQTGWDNIALYMWGDVNDLNGGWPGMSVTGTQTVNNVEYKYFDMGSANTGLNEHLIFNNGGNGVQLADFDYTISRDIYLNVTVTGVVEIDPSTFVPGDAPEYDTYKFYINDQTGWDAVALYAWGDNLPELYGGWPGNASYETETIEGVEYKVFSFPGNGNTYHLILNNNGQGSQIDGPALELNQDYYLEATATSFTEVGKPGEEKQSFSATYVNGNNWDEVYAYTYSPETAGSWPGVKLEKTGTVTISGTTYDVYTYAFEAVSAPGYIIFNNGNGGEGNQTADYEFENGKQYSEVEDANSIEGLSVSNADNSSFYNLLGIRMNKVAKAGVYIHNGKKVVLQ